jgi:hypothetical protein
VEADVEGAEGWAGFGEGKMNEVQCQTLMLVARQQLRTLKEASPLLSVLLLR